MVLFKIFLLFVGLSAAVVGLDYSKDVPSCLVKKCGRHGKIASRDRTKFYLCSNETDSTLEKCPEGLWFNNHWKDCVSPEMWVDPCIALLPCRHTFCHALNDKLWPSVNKSQILECKVSTFDSNYYEIHHKAFCPEGEWFDFDSQRCVLQENWSHPCSPTTKFWNPRTTCEESQLNMTFPYEGSPDFYFKCVKDDLIEIESFEGSLIPKVQFCPDDLVYDAHKKSCVEQKEWVDPLNITANCPKINCRESQRESLWPTIDQTKFIQCHFNESSEIWEPQVHSCSNETNIMWFNFVEQKCVEESDWEVPCKSESLAPWCIELTCEGEEKNRLWPSKDKNKFLQCAPVSGHPEIWEPMERPCPDGLYFNVDIQVCDWEHNWRDICEEA